MYSSFTKVEARTQAGKQPVCGRGVVGCGRQGTQIPANHIAANARDPKGVPGF